MRPDRFSSTKRRSRPSSTKSSRSSSRKKSSTASLSEATATTASSSKELSSKTAIEPNELLAKKTLNKPSPSSDSDCNNTANESSFKPVIGQVLTRRSLTRSLTRSPTPIKYDYDIYKKRSPTFGRRCPVLNRRPRIPTASSDNSTQSNSSEDKKDDTTITIPAKGLSCANTAYSNRDKSRNNHESSGNGDGKPPSSSRYAAGPSSGRPVTRDKTDNPSYFQHDNRESHKRSKNDSRKRKQRQSPFRWQHDLFEDDHTPSEKKEITNVSQHRESKIITKSG